jgi:voltage-gated potassium channel
LLPLSWPRRPRLFPACATTYPLESNQLVSARLFSVRLVWNCSNATNVQVSSKTEEASRLKFLPSQLTYFLKPATSRRNIRLLLRFLLVLAFLVTVFSILFHVLMVFEGREHSWLTGLYWTLTVMSTLGFGDITFTSDAGRVFSIIVLLSGMVFLLILLPFTFIEFFYAPWMKAQAELRAPRQLPESTSGHVILTNMDPVSKALMQKLTHYGYPYALLVYDLDEALRLHDLGFQVVLGESDRPETYRLVRADKAALVAATGNDMANTNVAFTVREMSQSVPIVTTASSNDAVDILRLAGSSDVIQLSTMMGQALARRIIGADARAHVIAEFGDLLIAEATAAGTPLVGKTLAGSNLRKLTGLSVIGIWKRGQYEIAAAESMIDANSILVLSGSAEQLRKYDEFFCIYHVSAGAVIIVGGGRVGRAIGRALKAREVDFRIVESNPARIRDQAIYVEGSAADYETLERAGIDHAPAIVITTHDDDMNVYLTIYCRRLRPDIQIISRSTRERNVSTLHRAGADFVLSYASMGATTIFNYLRRAGVVVIAEGLHLTETRVPGALAGRTLAQAAIPSQTGGNVVALRSNGELMINPEPSTILEHGAEIILIGTPEAEQRFMQLYGAEKLSAQPVAPSGNLS